MQIESLDVHKAQLDLQDQTRRDDVYNQMLEINRLLSDVAAFPSLLWAWTFDIIKDIYDNCKYEDLAVNDYVDEAVPTGVTLKQIWDKFWDDSDKNGFTLEFGVEDLDEALRDWLRESDFLVTLEDDGWLDDESNDKSGDN